MSEIGTIDLSLDENKTLHLSKYNFEEIPDQVFELVEIKRLFLWGGNLKVINNKISNLKNLISIGFSENKITEIPIELCELQNLERLILENNEISYLPKEIGNLKNLKGLYLKGNQLKELPIEIIQLNNLEELELDSSIPNIPEEVINSCKTNPAVLFNFLKERKVERNQAKLVICGEPASGKSCLLEAIIRKCEGSGFQPCRDEWISTDGQKLSKIRIDQEKDSSKRIPIEINSFFVNIFDFGGQVIYHPLHKFFMTRRSLYLLLWDSMDKIENSKLHYWLYNISSFTSESIDSNEEQICFNSKSPVLIIKNKIDKDKYNQILPINELINYFGKNIINPEYNLCLKEEESFNDLFEIIESILKSPLYKDLFKYQWPIKWIEIENKLDEISKKQNYINFDELYEQIKYIEPDPKIIRGNLGILNSWGKIIYFKENPLKFINDNDYTLDQKIILNPEWITNSIYKIVSKNKSNEIEKNHGILKKSVLYEIWSEEENYNEKDRNFLIELLEAFELAFEIDGKKNNYVIPSLLPTEPKYNDIGEVKISIRKLLNYTPIDIISSFIVKNYKNVIKNNNLDPMYWRTGIYIHEDGSKACIEQKENAIFIEISGKTCEERNAMLNSINKCFKDIFKKYRKIFNKDEIKCDKCQKYYDYNEMMNFYKADPEYEVECDNCNNITLVHKLLDYENYNKKCRDISYNNDEIIERLSQIDKTTRETLKISNENQIYITELIKNDKEILIDVTQLNDEFKKLGIKKNVEMERLSDLNSILSLFTELVKEFDGVRIGFKCLEIYKKIRDRVNNNKTKI